jgi:hypothetical protein
MQKTQKAPDERVVFLWHGRSPRDDAARLTEVVAQRAILELFRVDGALSILRDGRFVPVNPGIMRAIIAKHVQTIHWVNYGAVEEPQWKFELAPFEFRAGSNLANGPDERILVDMISDLTQKVAKGPARPNNLSLQQRHEILMRSKQGESADRIAAAYKVEPDVVKELARQAG